ncbi:protein ABA AND ROS SENSITIVE 1 isoform X2 [Malania oleifera]|uniref:protein ABA AND ROS SENSITIVE 1 isoform X2 n=1 Tax=Malania oleifera TaxID=397392 RepID=UPI0025AE69CE|nr:protein ABA AND ROS SENSITIVE 1 isoform X2 [Malania oleifera]
MDAQARKKALFRAKLKELEQKQDKRINSPLVRYNEFDQPVCRVCDIVLKSESFWQAHQVSRKHHEAIKNIKSDAAGKTQVKHVEPESAAGLPKSKLKSEHSAEFRDAKSEPSGEFRKARSSSELPADFFDNRDRKKPKIGYLAQNQGTELVDSEKNKDGFFSDDIVQTKNIDSQRKENKQVKGILPEGFFDNKDADLRARGIEPVKPDVKDEYKEFEKLIQEDLQEVDDRLEEEEFDAAETIEEAESLEQKVYREKVEILRKKKMELKACRSATLGRGPEVNKESKTEESSSDDDSDENFIVDWRAKHL